VARRAFDFYPTPAWATRVLMDAVNVHGVVYEPCVGRGDISDVLRAYSGRVRSVWTNDIDTARAADEHHDARAGTAWSDWSDWVVSNPPFSDAMAITRLAVENARVGVAMLLRLSFLEPTEDRGPWLAEHSPTHLIVCPRISFTGDGKTDSVTTAWLVWDKHACGQRLIVVPKARRAALLGADLWPAGDGDAA
jgi:hypothetical protein